MTRAMLLSNVVERAEAARLSTLSARRPPPRERPQEPRRVPSTLGGLVYLIVVAVSVVGLLVVAFGPWRRGVALIGAGPALGRADAGARCATATPGCCAYAATGGSTYSCSAASAPP